MVGFRLDFHLHFYMTLITKIVTFVRMRVYLYSVR